MKRFAAFLAAALLAANAHAQNLVLGTKLELNTLDPHFFAAFPTGSSHTYLYEKLILLDPKLKPRPALAESWKLLDDLTWEFKLRKGVTFHDGSPFTADDVLFTLERVPNVPNSPNSFSQYTRGIEKATRVDDHTVVLRTKAPNPMLPNDLSNVFIVSAKSAKGATTADFNSGKAAIGTGPYKLVEWVNGERLVVERNDKYWGAKPHWARVTEKVIAKDPTRLAALLSGQVDAIDAVPIADLERLRKEGRFGLFRGAAALVHYVALDSARDVSPFVTAKDGKPLAGNPLKDPRVRKALSLAINRDLLVKRVMEGSGVPASQLLSTEYPGASKSLKPDPFDAAKAQALLKEAGWGEGFRIVLHATADRYPNDAAVAQAIAQMWTRGGIPTKVVAMPSATFFPQATDLKFSVLLVGWSTGTGESSSSLKALLMTFNKDKGFGTANRGRYSNTKVDALTEDALQTVDDVKREAYLQRAAELAIGDTGIIPLHFQVSIWGTRDGIAYAPRVDEQTLAWKFTPTRK